MQNRKHKQKNDPGPATQLLLEASRGARGSTPSSKWGEPQIAPPQKRILSNPKPTILLTPGRDDDAASRKDFKGIEGLGFRV